MVSQLKSDRLPDDYHTRPTADSTDFENGHHEPNEEGEFEISKRNRKLIDEMMSAGIDADHSHIYDLYKKILATCFSEVD